MEEMKHTPGPWVCQTQANGSSIRHPVVLSDGGAVAMVQWCESTQKTNANASLIVAAPYLLEALQSLVNQFLQRGVFTDPEHPDRIALALAESAIAKATGGAA